MDVISYAKAKKAQETADKKIDRDKVATHNLDAGKKYITKLEIYNRQPRLRMEEI